MNKRLATFILGCALVPHAAPAEPPEIALGGIVSAADNSSTAAGLARGSIVSIYGRDLAGEIAAASGLPLPVALAGSRVTVRASSAEFEAGLLYVSPTQINAVIPESVPVGGAEIQVASAAGSSAPQPVSIVAARFTAFTTTYRPFGPALVQQHRSGEVRLNRMLDPALPGDALVIWGTGLGGRDPGAVTVSIGMLEVTPFYAGPAPGLPGVDQINLFLPEGVFRSCFVPFAIHAGGETSPVYTIATGEQAGVPCPAPFALGEEGLAALDAGGLVRITAMTVQETAAEAWVGEYDAAYLAQLATHDSQPFAAPLVCTRHGYSYDRFHRPPPRLVPETLYGLRRLPDALEVSVTGPGDCGWTFLRSEDGVYRASAPAGCPPLHYSIAKPGTGTRASGNVPDIPPSPFPPVAFDPAGAATWSENFSGRLTLDLSSSFTLPGSIFNGLTEVHELTCRLSGSSGTGRIPAAGLSWALGLPSQRAAVLRQWSGGLSGGSWGGPSEALFIRLLRLQERAIDLQ